MAGQAVQRRCSAAGHGQAVTSATQLERTQLERVDAAGCRAKRLDKLDPLRVPDLYRHGNRLVARHWDHGHGRAVAAQREKRALTYRRDRSETQAIADVP